MGLKRKQMLIQQKAYFEHKLKGRLSFLTGKGIASSRADKDTLVRKLQADIRAVNYRLRVIADNEKRTEERAKERAAALQKEQEGGRGEKPKKAPEEGKGKKLKAEKTAATPKAPGGGKSLKTTESPEEGKTTINRTPEKSGEEAAGRPKADKKSN